MKTLFTCLLIAAVGITHSIAQKDSTIVIAHTKTIKSAILGENRKVYIRTPAKMLAGETFPVMYILDGESFIQLASGQVQYLSESYKVIPSMIIVAIGNTDRTRDLTPTHFNVGPDGKPDTTANAFGRNSGGGPAFLEFINKELVPFVNKNYPVAPYKILVGHSLGGLMAISCLAEHPDYFNAYIAISPSLQWHNEIMLKTAAEKITAKTADGKILFFSDGNEGAKFHTNQLALDSTFKSRKDTGFKFQYVYYPDESHVSEPVKALYDGLRLVYPEWHLNYNSAFRQKVNSSIMKDHYNKLSKTYGYTVVPLQEEIIQLSRFLRNDPKRISDAINILETYLPYYSGVVAMHELLGDIYKKAGDPLKAKESYQKALELDPANEAIKSKLQ